MLPLFKRKSTKVEEVVPELYLHGLARGDFERALQGFLGDEVPVSSSTVARLKETWQAQLAHWRSRPLAEVEAVYLWVDGTSVKAGLEIATAVLWKMLLVAEQAFRRLKAPDLMPEVYRGTTYVNGARVKTEVAA